MDINGETIIDDLPISAEEPGEYLFGGSESREKRWKTDMNVPEEADAESAYGHLRKFFKLDGEEWEHLTKQQERLMVSLRSGIYLQRYNREPMTVALNISELTFSVLEEQNQDFPGIRAEVDYLLQRLARVDARACFEP
jgi:hypothetical protein